MQICGKPKQLFALKIDIVEIVGMFGDSPTAESSAQRGNLQCVTIMCAILCRRVLRKHGVHENGRISVETLCRY